MELYSRDISVDLGGRKILNNINLHIGKKEFVGIIGPNGSGKSSLLKTMYRTLKPKSGSIYIDGSKIEAMSLRDTAKKIAVVAQHNDSDFDFSVLDMVLVERSPHKKFMERDNKDDYDMAFDALDKVGMTAFTDRNFNSLSGGEKQRVILARALAQDTSCLILDEPTNHLDIKYQLQFMSIAKSLDITVISAIHDLNIASIYCDKIYDMKAGGIVAYGSPKEIITRELIKELYEVDSEVNIGESGSINIIYKPFKF